MKRRCNKCKGTGLFTRVVLGGSTECFTQPCTRCNGTGQMNRVTKAEKTRRRQQRNNKERYCNMADRRPESRIIVSRSQDGKSAKIHMVDPKTGRESIPTEVRGDNREIEKRIEQVKAINERAGNHATVREV